MNSYYWLLVLLTSTQKGTRKFRRTAIISITYQVSTELTISFGSGRHPCRPRPTWSEAGTLHSFGIFSSTSRATPLASLTGGRHGSKRDVLEQNYCCRERTRGSKHIEECSNRLPQSPAQCFMLRLHSFETKEEARAVWRKTNRMLSTLLRYSPGFSTSLLLFT